MHFLDKFVYRNPKAADAKRGMSIMQPVLAAGSAAHIVASGKAASKKQPSLNSATFWNKKAEDVAIEDVFFHEYFSQIGKPGQAGKTKKEKKKKTDGEGTDSEAEDEIWQALVDSRPDIQGDEEGDVDMDMSDDESDLRSLLDMSDSDGEEGQAARDDGRDSQDSEGGVEFFDFSEGEAAEAEGEARREAALKQSLKGGRMRKRDLKALPMFASADEYAAMLGAEEEEDS